MSAPRHRVRLNLLMRVADGRSQAIPTPFNTLHAMLRASDGAVWINADGKLWELVGDKIELVPGPDDFPDAKLKIQAMTLDRSGTLWILP